MCQQRCGTLGALSPPEVPFDTNKLPPPFLISIRVRGKLSQSPRRASESIAKRDLVRKRLNMMEKRPSQSARRASGSIAQIERERERQVY